MMRMLWIKAIVGIIKKKLRVRYSKSSVTMMRILGIKEIVDKLMEELNHECLDADIQGEMEKLLTYIRELQYRLPEKEAALKAQQSNIEKSMRRSNNNIIHSRNPNTCCEGFVVSAESGYVEGLSEKLRGCRFTVIRNRKQIWHGLSQDITNRVSTCYSYTFCAWVGIANSQAPQSVLASLKHEYKNSFFFTRIGCILASPERWEKLEATFAVVGRPRPFLMEERPRPHRITLYLEGHKPGVDLLIRSIAISPLNYLGGPQSITDTILISHGYGSQSTGSLCDDDENIIQNPRFEDGLNNWSIGAAYSEKDFFKIQ